MAQKTGALIFDETADRYDIRFDIADYYGGLHCGECMDVFTGGKWKPTVDELEAKVKAGEQISLVDLAEAIKADKERGKEKPSIRAQLKADKERAGKKKNAKQKSQDLERS